MTTQKIYRIIDANINRTMEGLRVVEEYFRFVTDNKKLTQKLKDFRHQLKKIISKFPAQSLLSSRDTRKDEGAKLYSKEEAKRETIISVVKANWKRAEEALRVLEEYSKLISPSMGKDFKNLRFKSYQLEKEIFPLLFEKKNLDFDLYVVTDPTVTKKSHQQVAKEAIAGGAKIIQLRDKEASLAKITKYARQIRRLTRKNSATLIINDYITVAQKSDADGIHLGQDDISPKLARKILGDEKIIGISTHSLKQAIKAGKDGVDYISVGPIFPTPTKPKTKPVGLSLLHQVKKKVNVPIVAIGGINEKNIKQVVKTGIKRVAVIRAALGTKNITRAVIKLRSQLNPRPR